MNGLELNKIAAAVLLAGLIAMITGTIAEALYEPEKPKARGYQVEVAEEAPAGAAKKEPQIVDVGALLAAASVEKGQEIAKKCAVCHSFEKGGPNKVGPNLYGVVNGPHAHKGDFAYSDSMKGLHDKKWSVEELYHFIYNPKDYVKGTKMAFAGIKKPEDLAALLVYLNSVSDAPAPLPSDLKITQ